jgi:2-hydroxychromene-2-carboxylate isomerase
VSLLSSRGLAIPLILTVTTSVSPYSWFGFTNVMKFRPLLNAHGVSVDVIPFFLGGARESAGNPFSPTPKAKEAFATQDSEMTGELLGLKVVRPKIWPVLSLFVSVFIFTLQPKLMRDSL